MGMYICEVSKIRTRTCWSYNYCLLYLLCNNGFVRVRYSVRMVMKMTLEEAIKHAKDITKDVSECTDCRMEHKQLTGWLEELLAYRKMDKQGRLMRLPCKVGSNIYRITDDGIDVAECREITVADKEMYIESNTFCDWISFDEIGKTVLLTEAEAKLKEMEESHEGE